MPENVPQNILDLLGKTLDVTAGRVLDALKPTGACAVIVAAMYPSGEGGISSAYFSCPTDPAVAQNARLAILRIAHAQMPEWAERERHRLGLPKEIFRSAEEDFGIKERGQVN